MYFIDEEFASTKCWKNDIRFLVDLCFEIPLSNAAPSPLSGENAAVNIGVAVTIGGLSNSSLFAKSAVSSCEERQVML